MSKLNDQKIANLEKEIQNKKKEFSSEKEKFEKKINDLETQIATLKKSQEKMKNNKKTTASQTIAQSPDENLSNLKKDFEKKILSVCFLFFLNFYNNFKKLIQEKNGLIEKMNHLIVEKAQAFDQIACLQKERNENQELHEIEENMNIKQNTNEKLYINEKAVSNDRKKGFIVFFKKNNFLNNKKNVIQNKKEN